MSFAVEEGKGAHVSVREQDITVGPGTPVTVALHGQGPRDQGVVQLHTGEKRKDGSIITATVPQDGISYR